MLVDESAATALPEETAGELARLRRSIDAVNLEILRLLESRGALVVDITHVKHRGGMALRDSLRERDMLAELARQSRGPFQRREIEAVFRAVFEASRSLGARCRAPHDRKSPS